FEVIDPVGITQKDSDDLKRLCREIYDASSMALDAAIEIQTNVERPDDEETAARQEDALSKLEKCLELVPRHFEASQLLSIIRFQEGMSFASAMQLEAAAQAFAKAAKAKPTYRKARENATNALLMLVQNDFAAGKYDVAADRLMSARELDPESPDI